MTFTVSSIDLQSVMGRIIEHESLLYGKEGLDEDDITEWVNDPRYHDGMILTESGHLAAYAFMRSVKPGSIRIMRLCVLPRYQHKGYGRALHDAIMLDGFQYRARVPERWLETQLWLKRRGWKAVGIAEDGIEFRIKFANDFSVS
jgi:ribosomal protein S18 acetylase RimI-like enzyme